MSKSSDNPTGWCLSAAFKWHPVFEECIDPNSLYNFWKQQETSAGDKDSWADRRNHKTPIKHEITACPQTSLLIGLFWQPEFGKVTIRITTVHKCESFHVLINADDNYSHSVHQAHVRRTSGLSLALSFNMAEAPERHLLCNWSCTFAIFCLIKEIQCENDYCTA